MTKLNKIYSDKQILIHWLSNMNGKKIQWYIRKLYWYYV